MRTRAQLTLLLLAALLASPMLASGQAAMADSKPQLLDRVVAVVNGDVILQSDLEEEERFAPFQLFNSKTVENPDQQALDRLIDRTLIQQQMRNQPNLPKVSDADLDKEITQLRKTIPECATYACYTDKGWQKFCEIHGFTPQQIADRWRQRMTLLAFIEQRFRTGIRISHGEIEDYYNKSFVPRFKQRNLVPPPLNSISDRIQEILLQQRVNALLSEWLQSLRDQGSVQILDPALVSKPDASSSTKGGSAN
jgi:hypothetical protein